jgi:hypothetical protein
MGDVPMKNTDEPSGVTNSSNGFVYWWYLHHVHHCFESRFARIAFEHLRNFIPSGILGALTWRAFDVGIYWLMFIAGLAFALLTILNIRTSLREFIDLRNEFLRNKYPSKVQLFETLNLDKKKRSRGQIVRLDTNEGMMLEGWFAKGYALVIVVLGLGYQLLILVLLVYLIGQAHQYYVPKRTGDSRIHCSENLGIQDIGP